MSYVSSDEINVKSERYVLTAVMAWIKHNENERVQLLPQMFQSIRLHYLTKEVCCWCF